MLVIQRKVGIKLMRIFRIFGRSIRNAGKSIFRNLSLSMASITCSIITLILVSIGMLISYNINNITKNIENELTIVVFMDKDINQDELNKTKEDLNKIDNVKSVTLKTKEDIKNSMASENDTFNKIISTWKDGENPLQDSFIIDIVNARDINETATTIKNMEKVSLVKYGENTVNQLIDVFSIVKKVTIGLVIGLVLVTAFLINNTIKITIFSRKREIDIMRLVGTSNMVIKLPFLIEGLFIGFLGSIIPILLTIFGYTYAYNELGRINLNNIMNIINLVSPGDLIYKVSLYILIIGTVIGGISSFRAVRKHLTI